MAHLAVPFCWVLLFVCLVFGWLVGSLVSWLVVITWLVGALVACLLACLAGLLVS